MILSIPNVYIWCIMFNNSVRNLISAKNISRNTQRGTDQTPPQKKYIGNVFSENVFRC